MSSVEEELQEAKRRLELAKAKVKAEIEVFLTAMNLNDAEEVRESFRRLKTLVEEGWAYSETSLPKLIKRVNELERVAQSKHPR